MQRFPDGAARQVVLPEAGARRRAADWLRDHDGQHAERHHVATRWCSADLAHVVWAVNLGCLGFHVVAVRTADDLEHADELRIDLDPSPGVTFDDDPRGRRTR